MLVIRSITWVAIAVNWVLILALARQLRRARQREVELHKDMIHYAIACGAAMGTLHMVAPGTQVPLPEETYRWMEARHLEYLVYGDE